MKRQRVTAGSMQQGAESGTPEAGESSHHPAWLLEQKVAIPERVAGHLERRELVKQCMPTDHRVTVLKAPGGFGKTTLLADACRSLRQRGIIAAWLSLDEYDEESMLDSYLAYAFQHAGLDILAAFASESGPGSVMHRTALLVRAVESHGELCVLALDQLERLDDPGALSLLSYLLHRAPSPHFSPGAVMIAEDFGSVRVLATESIAGTTVEGARARTGPKDPRGRGQRSPQSARSSASRSTS